MAAIAAKVLLEAISRGTDMVPDKYWDRIPGMRPPKTEEEYKETKAKVDADEAKYGRYGSDQRKRNDKERHSRQPADRRSIRKHGSGGHDRHRARRRSQSDERRADRRRDHGLRTERRTLERRASSYSPPPPEDQDFYNDVERRRQDRRAQTWGVQPAATLDRPYIPMPQQGGPVPASYQQAPPPPPPAGPAGATARPGGVSSYAPPHPLSTPQHGQANIPQQPRAGFSRPPVSFAQFQSPNDSQRSSMHSSTPSFSPAPSSPYTPISATSSRPTSWHMNSHLPPQSTQAQQGTVGPDSKAAQKYTPPGVVPGTEMYPAYTS